MRIKNERTHLDNYFLYQALSTTERSLQTEREADIHNDWSLYFKSWTLSIPPRLYFLADAAISVAYLVLIAIPATLVTAPIALCRFEWQAAHFGFFFEKTIEKANRIFQGLFGIASIEMGKELTGHVILSLPTIIAGVFGAVAGASLTLSVRA